MRKKESLGSAITSPPSSAAARLLVLRPGRTVVPPAGRPEGDRAPKRLGKKRRRKEGIERGNMTLGAVSGGRSPSPSASSPLSPLPPLPPPLFFRFPDV